eukprot:2931294-Lingulodinium_polyedra.AAC.1
MEASGDVDIEPRHRAASPPLASRGRCREARLRICWQKWRLRPLIHDVFATDVKCGKCYGVPRSMGTAGMTSVSSARAGQDDARAETALKGVIEDSRSDSDADGITWTAIRPELISQ